MQNADYDFTPENPEPQDYAFDQANPEPPDSTRRTDPPPTAYDTYAERFADFESGQYKLGGFLSYEKGYMDGAKAAAAKVKDFVDLYSRPGFECLPNSRQTVVALTELLTEIELLCC